MRTRQAIVNNNECTILISAPTWLLPTANFGVICLCERNHPCFDSAVDRFRFGGAFNIIYILYFTDTTFSQHLF